VETFVKAEIGGFGAFEHRMCILGPAESADRWRLAGNETVIVVAGLEVLPTPGGMVFKLNDRPFAMWFCNTF
jgi:hypothetical protein